MITLLIGENSFEIERKLHEIKSQFDGVCETVDGAEVELKQFPDLLMGATLFASSRLVVLKRLSENKALWNGFEAWIPRISDDTHLVLIDSKPDKRTKTFKELQKVANAVSIPFIPADTSKPNYTVDHSGNLAVIGPDGTQRGFIRAPLNNAKLVAQLPVMLNRK